MVVMPVYLKSKMIYDRNSLGQFAAKCDRAARETAEELAKLGERTSRSMAPSSGYNVASYSKRPGYVPLKRSIRSESAGKRGWWYSIAPHAMYVEFPTSPHLIYGRLSFQWSGGEFFWHDYRYGPIGRVAKGPYRVIRSGAYKNWSTGGGAWVLHPGTGAQPFLRPAYERVVKRQAMAVARKHYPG